MSWTKFKEKYLFSVNFAIMLSAILYSVRKDFSYHFIVGIWLIVALSFSGARDLEKKFLHLVGKINSTLILVSFYFLFFTPFSVIYKLFLKNRAFKKVDSRFEKKESISSFSTPF